MKARVLVSFLILVLAVLVIAGSCATGKRVNVAKEDEELLGTWINTDYDNTWKYGKIIIKPDGTYDEYDKSYSDSALTWRYTITDKWIDSDGNIFYKYTVISLYEREEELFPTWYYLAKIDKTGNVFEYVDSSFEFPSEIDLNHANYAIHYRQ